jgi:type I restriction enzyme S subunit
VELRRGYKQTEVGVIPEDWEVKPLGKFVALQRGHDLTERQRQRGEVPVMGSAGPNGFHDTALVRGPGVVLGRSGASFGQAHYCASDFWPHNTALYVTDFFGNHPLFSFYFLKSIDFSRHNSGGAQQSLNRNFIAPIRIAVPKGNEQEAIAGVLSDTDALIESLERLIAKKRKIKQGAMQELLTGRKRLPGFADQWQVKSIGEFTNCIAGGTPSTLVPSYWGGSVRWMSSGELNQRFVSDVVGRITETGLRNCATKIIPTKCVLVGLAGQGKTRGTVAMNLVELCTNQSIAAILPSAAFVPDYLYYNLDMRYSELRDLSAGDGGRGGLNLTIIKRIPIPFPTIQEQTAIAAVLSDMDSEITALEIKLARTRQLKQGMMEQLLTGRTRLI